MRRPHIIDSAGIDYHLCGWAFNRGMNRELGASYEGSCEVFGPSASAGFYRRAALEKAGWLLPSSTPTWTTSIWRFVCAGPDTARCTSRPPACSISARHPMAGTTTGGPVDRCVTRKNVFWTNLPLAKLLLGLVPHLAFLSVRLVRNLFGPNCGRFSRAVARCSPVGGIS